MSEGLKSVRLHIVPIHLLLCM